jgi:hypothetical protein
MGKKSGPKAPNYAAAAEAQGQASLALTDKQTAQNRPDVYTPWGSQTWTNEGGDKWTSRVTLSPQEQASLDSQMAIQQGRSDAAKELLGQATDAFQTPMNWNNLPSRAGNVQAGNLGPNPNLDPNSANDSFNAGRGVTGAFMFGQGNNPNAIRERAQEAVWQMQKPALDQRRESTEVQLANQGLARGSEAWNREMQRLDDSEARARLSAVEAGRQEADMLFGQGIQGVDQANRIAGQEYQQNMGQAGFENQADQMEFDNAIRAAQMGDNRALQQLQMKIAAGNFANMNRQGAISEETMRRGQTLNELNALLTGQQVNMPTMPNQPNSTAGRAETPDLLGAAGMQYQSNLDRYNAQMGGLNNLLGIGQSAAFMFSDARLKEDIQPTGGSIGGVPVVYYRYRGLPGLRVGVIAQDVLRVKPHAVALDPSGYLMVNYLELAR